MSNLIITLISIALIGLVAVSTLFFGGDAFKQGSVESEVNRYLNESSQITGAVRMYQADNMGAMPSDLEADLVSEYLETMPKAGDTWSIGQNTIEKSVESKDKCEVINKKAGLDAEPKSCDDPSLAGATYFCCYEDEA